VTYQFRLAVCGTALVIGLSYFAGVFAAAPSLPKETQKRQADADIAMVKQQLKFIAENPKEFNAKAAAWTVKTLAFTLAMNAEAAGDAALRDHALKVAEASVKLSETVKARPTMRDEKAVLAAAKETAALADKMTFKPGSAPLAAAKAFKMDKYEFDLWQVMTPFRPGDRGGTNIEKDIRDMVKKDNPLKIDPAHVEILAARTASIGNFILEYPNDKAKVKGAAEWKQLTTDMMRISEQLAAEAGKGATADEKKLLTMIDALNGKCYKCHSEFRDE
jgi:hypothetical protein